MSTFLRTFLFSAALVFGAASVAAQSVVINNAPTSATMGSSIQPRVTATMGSYPLNRVSISYSWNNSTWTVSGSTSSPTNPSDTEGNAFTLTQTGTLYLKGEAWDVVGHYVSTTKTVSVTSSPPTVVINNAPSSATIGTTITPSVTATKGGSNLTTVIISYSWNNSTWTQLGANPSPLNPTDTEGNPVTLNQTGTFYLKGEAWDAAGNHVVTTTTVAVSGLPPTVSISGAPSSATVGTTITPRVTATKGTANLTTVIISYSWDNATWTQLGANPSPLNPTDSEGNPVTLNQSGTFYLKGEAWDAAGFHVVTNATVSVVQTYSLTVQNGSGSASGLSSGTGVAISANGAPSGQTFSSWTLVSGPGSFANSGASSTTFTMGAGNATVNATYRWLPPSVSSGSASGTSGTAFSYQISATNSPTSYGASGLPAGLSVNASTGLISGTPSQTGSFSVSLSASNSGGTGTGTLSLTIAAAAPPPPVVSSGSASGTAGTAFSYQMSATNSPTSYGASGLPGGLSINTSTGLISGTPTQSGSFSVGMSATNSGGTGTGTLSLSIAAALPPRPVITSATTASGTAGAAFNYQITATNSPTSYNATGLPSGLSVNTGTGLISGTPSVSGSFNVSLSASNAGGTGTATLSLTISSAPPQTDTTNQNQLNIHLPY